MKIETFIEKAIEGEEGNLPKHKVVRVNRYWVTLLDGNGSEYTQSLEVFLLRPETWQAVGKVEGWATQKEIEEWEPHRMGSHSDTWGCAGDDDPCFCTRPKDYIYYMHAMIDALAEGKSLEQFINTL